MNMATLFVVATPIGNLEDLSPRAARVLAESPVVAAESVGRAKKLLAHLGLGGKWLISCREANRRQAAAKVLEALGEGKDVALISDAGTPGLSDPGQAVVEEVAKLGHRISPVAGPSALAAALSVAGIKTGALCVPGLFAGQDRGAQASVWPRPGPAAGAWWPTRPPPHGRGGQGFGRGLGRAPGGALPGADQAARRDFALPPAPSWPGVWTRTSSGAR